MQIIARYEKGMKFLDLCRYYIRLKDEDGTPVEEECWEVVIYDNEPPNYDAHRIVEFDSEYLARMYISLNEWKEQVL